MLKISFKNLPKQDGKVSSRISVILILAIGLSVYFASPLLAFDFSDWDRLVKRNVSLKVVSGIKFNSLNYKNIKSDPTYLNLLEDIKNYNLTELKTKNDKLAFWINAYNIMAVKMVLDNYPLETIKDAGSLFKPVWKKEVGLIAGKVKTLNDIEHKILRKMDEPRIHFSIVCASVSCPDLRPEAYVSEKINSQLEDQLKKFLANPKKGLKIDSTSNQLYLSSIFKWFEEDFETKGGVFNYLTKYIDSEHLIILKSRKLKIKYLDYDWRLNE